MGNSGSAHPLIEVNVSFKFEENPSISKGVIERTRIGDGRTDQPTRQSESSIAPPPPFWGGGIITFMVILCNHQCFNNTSYIPLPYLTYNLQDCSDTTHLYCSSTWLTGSFCSMASSKNSSIVGRNILQWDFNFIKHIIYVILSWVVGSGCSMIFFNLMYKVSPYHTSKYTNLSHSCQGYTKAWY